ncbi:hypothetical protein KM043_005575 [Ampulex compressa]|nr:hypothetical protein KM043_005575 [Ampulex compressa]
MIVARQHPPPITAITRDDSQDQSPGRGARPTLEEEWKAPIPSGSYSPLFNFGLNPQLVKRPRENSTQTPSIRTLIFQRARGEQRVSERDVSGAASKTLRQQSEIRELGPQLSAIGYQGHSTRYPLHELGLDP